MKKIYVNAFTSENFGDDLFVRTLCERYPEHRFFLQCEAGEDRAFLNIPNLTVYNRSAKWGKFRARARKWITKLGLCPFFAYDAQVYIGGSIFIEFQDPVSYNSYFENLYSSKLFPKLPYFILGANFGPHHTEDFVEKHKEYFTSQVNDLCMRDKKSYGLFQDLPNVRYAPDILCTYDVPAGKEKNLILISCIFNDGREEISQFSNDDYERKLTELCEYYISLGKEVCLLSLCNLQKDHLMCQRVKEHFSEKVTVADYQGGIDKVVDLFARAEYVIASRFHAMILGWLAKTPVFPIYYSNKTINVIRDYGFDGTYASILDFPSLSCEEIDQNRLNGYLFGTETLQAEAQKQFLKLDEFMQKS